MSETLLIVVVTAAVNGAVTWGAISVKLAWLRRDIDRLERRVNRLRCLACAAADSEPMNH